MSNIAQEIAFLGAQGGWDDLENKPIVAITVRLEPETLKASNFILTEDHARRLHSQLSIALRSPVFVGES